jgi:hypothetical protein
MKKYVLSFLAAAMVLVVPVTSLAASCGYYEYYTDYKKVSSYEPVSRYVCDGRGYDYYRGYRDCYYTTEYVKTYKYKPVEKKRYVDKACYNQTSNSYVRGYDNGYYDGSNGYSYSPYTGSSYNSNSYYNNYSNYSDSYYNNSYYNNYDSGYNNYYGNSYSSYYGYQF